MKKLISDVQCECNGKAEILKVDLSLRGKFGMVDSTPMYENVTSRVIKLTN